MSSDESRRQAVALAYQDHDRAPRVVAKGYGELAERIMAEAQRQGIYVHDAPELVGLLMQLDLDAEIPANLYQVIAELLVWVFELSEAGLTKRESAE
ncbi:MULTISPECIES: EscU/YscU/HrcU family type III secretion system export apparatus switch protein [unclassified Halomonas]|uniref:EscU/YscU/HrcU family type III secretion system export apparatus switch protein n=1 Tax=unclassified Halomonas TaxID=2609666 RepID=UPI0006DAA42F|nr:MULTISPECIES: EscU/YscU/HrcU family type III secretion system export apparatus switch protein [unclassified Halomonas]KPQ22305.1 MAG: flagellar biosynthesis protein [Halomonas sp. HL-93]SBR52335.1 flagellar biosynthesis protein [Halomonas sp. HL-93]SNY98060.1 flagellar biosynthesis protein [Halomonas sp. hl-4]